MAAPATVTMLVRKVRPPATWTREIGWLTVLFGIGQCIGPLLAGALSTRRQACAWPPGVGW
jgi:hypothetical protein